MADMAGVSRARSIVSSTINHTATMPLDLDAALKFAISIAKEVRLVEA